MKNEEIIQENGTKKKGAAQKERDKGWEMTGPEILLGIVFTLVLVGQIVLLFFYNNELGLAFLKYIGWGFWGLSGILGILPIIILKIKGGVKKGESYVNTSKLVTTGLYALIRHPQYLSFMLLSTSITLITQSWISLILNGVIIVLTYLWGWRADKSLLEKFGEEYKEYKEQVPRFNLLFGIIKYAIRKVNS
ncbi:MAG: DUF1295 domain-containing protein [Candidatus Heimdallarchaeota archaeon]|nr:DUF1295 domain-containing protein [Candidatus Heimdallarchaeota archaeon]